MGTGAGRDMAGTLRMIFPALTKLIVPARNTTYATEGMDISTAAAIKNSSMICNEVPVQLQRLSSSTFEPVHASIHPRLWNGVKNARCSSDASSALITLAAVSVAWFCQYSPAVLKSIFASHTGTCGYFIRDRYGYSYLRDIYGISAAVQYFTRMHLEIRRATVLKYIWSSVSVEGKHS